MTDLEITKLCAEAMGYTMLDNWCASRDGSRKVDAIVRWNPLHDDAQAMALVKKLNLYVLPHEIGWSVFDHAPGSAEHFVCASDLNLAICECVAKMQASRSDGDNSA